MVRTTLCIIFNILLTRILINSLATGPYAPAVLRFQISFPDTYPKLPPLVLFSTDIFHPLITPLTTYMYAADIQDNGTVSASDQERLPPGGFSLRHGFPEWFGRGKRAASGSRQVSGERTVSSGSENTSVLPQGSAMCPEPPNPNPSGYSQTHKQSASIYSILKYIRSTFDTSKVIDTVPIAAAGNPGAWHAWRTHRRKQGKLTNEQPSSSEKVNADDAKRDISEKQEELTQSHNPATRRPAEWNWDGVWEDRVKKGVAASLSEGVLYGGSGVPDEMVSKQCQKSTSMS